MTSPEFNEPQVEEVEGVNWNAVYEDFEEPFEYTNEAIDAQVRMVNNQVNLTTRALDIAKHFEVTELGDMIREDDVSAYVAAATLSYPAAVAFDILSAYTEEDLEEDPAAGIELRDKMLELLTSYYLAVGVTIKHHVTGEDPADLPHLTDVEPLIDLDNNTEWSNTNG